MTEHECADAGVQAEGEKTDDNGVGYRRLESELTAFRAEFESLAEAAATRGDTVERIAGWETRGRTLLDRADAALKSGKIEQGWNYLHEAKRLRTYGLEALDEPALLQGEARELLAEATNAGLGWRTDAIRERLTTTNGNLRENLTWTDLRSALELLHGGYERVHLKREYLQSQFRYLSLFAGVAIVVLLVVAMASLTVGFLPSPFENFSEERQPETSPETTGDAARSPDATDGATESPDATDEDAGSSAAAADQPVEPVGFLVYVVLAGVLGASLFGLRSLQKQPISGATPQFLTARQAAVTRIVVGAGSALAVFFFVRSGLLPVSIAAGVDDGPFLVSFAFFAGYSERLVHATVESVANKDDADTNEEA